MDAHPASLHGRIFALLVLFLVGSLFTAAWAGNSKIAGRVTARQSGEALAGANVVITHAVQSGGREVPLSRPLGAAADPEGYFFILDVPPGVYHLKGSAVGYTPEIQKFVRIESDRTVTVNFVLTSAELQLEGVEVVAAREIIRPDVSGTQEVVSTARIEQMPVMRVDEFMGKLKGITLVSTTEGNGLSIRGGAPRETDVRVDGISLQDPRTEISYLSLNSTAFEELQIVTGGFEAKYGQIRSGLLNAVSKEGSPERYALSLKADYVPEGQRRFFGESPWDPTSWIYRVYAGEYAMHGVPAGDTTVPAEFRSFQGWTYRNTPPVLLDSTQKLELWKEQHPQYGIARRPDIFLEGSLSGPVPGGMIPVWGEFAGRTTFLLGFRYEDTQLAFPLGERDNYVDWNGQLRLTTALSDQMRLSVNGMYAKIATSSSGRASSYGGALLGQSSSFGFLNNTQSSVSAQAQLIGGSSFNQIYNRSRVQAFDQRYIVGGAKFTHTLSGRAFYTIDFQIGYTDQQLSPFAMDTSRADQYAYYTSARTRQTYRYYLPQYGSPNASTNYGFDPLNTFAIYGGPQRVDSSYSWVYQLKGDVTAQLGRHHQVEAGFSARLQDLFVYTGTWFQSQLSYTPDTWLYYSQAPVELGLYVQDKLEFEGMILNAGLRFDYFNPRKDGFSAAFPLSEEYARLLAEIYPSLPGSPDSYARWEAYRALLEDPPGWPRTENNIQTAFSPRLGVSFPISTASKMYFNYGHFFQRPPVAFLYNTGVSLGGVAVPTPELAMAQTVQYEFGYEQTLFDAILLNLTAYYKDVRGEPLSRSFIGYDDYTVTQYYADAYSDTRGVEARVEGAIGRFVSLNAMYDYMLRSTGQSGLYRVYEDRLKAREGELRSPNVTVTEPRPRANVNLNLHTPADYGPTFLGIQWFGDLVADIFFEWRDGGRILMNPGEPDLKQWIYADIVNFWNIDLRVSKNFRLSFGNLELVVTVKNLWNEKFLTPENMTQTQYSDYKASLKTPDKGGSDQWGEYDKDYINVGWYQAPIFLNPRRVIFGLRLNI
jgi:outer membrane receptor protein involved in Fe transport